MAVDCSEICYRHPWVNDMVTASKNYLFFLDFQARNSDFNKGCLHIQMKAGNRRSTVELIPQGPSKNFDQGGDGRHSWHKIDKMLRSLEFDPDQTVKTKPCRICKVARGSEVPILLFRHDGASRGGHWGVIPQYRKKKWQIPKYLEENRPNTDTAYFNHVYNRFRMLMVASI